LLTPAGRIGVATCSIRQARGAIVSGSTTLLPSSSTAVSRAVAAASRSKPIKKLPSRAIATGAPSSVRARVPGGAWPLSQPPCVSAPT
jgi:hypothetical protein